MLTRSLIALALLCAFTARASEPAPIVPGFAPLAVTTTAELSATSEAPLAPVLPPRSNEAMEFQVSYLGMSMGKFRLFAGAVDSTIAPVFLQAQTTSIFAIVTLRQQLSSYLDVHTGLPRSGQLDAVEGSYRHTDTVSFDRLANKAKVREKGKYDNTYLIDVPPDATDFIALCTGCAPSPSRTAPATRSTSSPAATRTRSSPRCWDASGWRPGPGRSRP